MSTPVLSDVPSLIAAHMRAAIARKPGGKAGPFTIGLDGHSGHPMRNFAVPDDGAAPGPQDIARIRAMTARGGVVTVAVDDESGSVAGTGLVDVPGPGSGTGNWPQSGS